MPTGGRSSFLEPCAPGRDFLVRAQRASFTRRRTGNACPSGLLVQVYREVARRGSIAARHAADFDLCGPASSRLAHVHSDRQELDSLQQVNGNVT